MHDGIATIASSSSALTEHYRVVTENIANSNTPGYKRRCSKFQETLSGVASAAGMANSKINFNTGVDFSQGSLTQTGRKLDVAIDGKGFLVIDTPEGPIYSRGGSLQLNKQGQIVDSAGRIVSGESGPITLPSGGGDQSLEIGSDGTVSMGGRALGKLKIVEFENVSELEEIGGLCFRAPDRSEAPAKDSTIYQGYQEASNVNTVEELVELIKVTRLYEANMKNVTSQDDRMKELLRVAAG